MHKPVLLKEALDFLNVRDGIYVDCTVGTGGHSIEILKALNGKGMLIGLDRDESALEIARERLKEYKNCYLFHSNYLDLKTILKKQNINSITGGVLMDLGSSSLHFDDLSRGFSFKNNAPLDMRMDRSQTLTAFEVINKYKESTLADIIYNYGEERHSRKIARLIVEKRAKNGPIKTTNELSDIIIKCYPKGIRFKIHPATRTFQAIRIEVNKELENINEFMCFIPELLSTGSRLTVISFHSLEDRIIKNCFKNASTLKVLTKKPVTPSEEEILYNPRARSAKLRATERI